MPRKGDAAYRYAQARANGKVYKCQADRDTLPVFDNSIQIAVRRIIIIGCVAGESEFIVNVSDQGRYRDAIAFPERGESLGIVIQFPKLVFNHDLVIGLSGDEKGGFIKLNLLIG